MQPSQPNLKDSLNSLKKSIDNLNEETKRANNKPELDYSLQRSSAKHAIYGVYASIGLSIIIFIVGLSTRLDVNGMEDLLKAQDTAIHKQDSLILGQNESIKKQDSILSALDSSLKAQILLDSTQTNSLVKQDAIIDRLKTSLDNWQVLLRSQGVQNGLISDQLTKLQTLVEKSNNVDSMSRLQYEQLTGVLRSVDSSVQIMQSNLIANKRQGYLALLDSVETFSKIDSVYSSLSYTYKDIENDLIPPVKSKIRETLYGSTKLLNQKMHDIRPNTFLLFDITGQDRYWKVFADAKILEQQFFYLGKTNNEDVIYWKDCLAALLTLKKDLKSFEDYIFSLKNQLQNVK